MIQRPAGHWLIESVGLMQANVREVLWRMLAGMGKTGRHEHELNIAHERNGSGGSENI